MKSLLELYKCKDYQELYELVKSGKAPDLQDEIDELFIDNNFGLISNSDDAMRIINHLDIADGDYILFSDVKGVIRKIVKLDERINELSDDALLEISFLNHYAAILIFSDEYMDQEKREVINSARLKILDEFTKRETDTVYCRKANRDYDYDWNPELEFETKIITQHKDTKVICNPKFKTDYPDFLECYLKNETSGVSIEKAKDIVNKSMTGLLHEYVFIMPFDEDLKVHDFKILSRGDQTGCFVDPRTIYLEMKTNGLDGFVFGHNHPSTVPTASDEDIILNQIMSKIAASMNVKYCNIICGSQADIVQGQDLFRQSLEKPDKKKSKELIKSKSIVEEHEEVISDVPLPPIEAMRDI